MANVVFVPGLFGTELVGADGFLLWPPTGTASPTEPQTPIDPETRARRIIDPSTRIGGILKGIQLGLANIPQYSPVLNAIGQFPGVTLHEFPYDWRRDILDIADELAGFVAQIDNGDEIILVGHSMGGLVCRTMLEGVGTQGEDWFKNISLFIPVAVPHLGAPEAVFRVFGLEGLDHLLFPASCFRILTSVPGRFPGGHQLLPRPDEPCVRLPGGQQVTVDAAFPGKVPKAGLTALGKVHRLLSKYQKPQGVAYNIVFCTGNDRTTTAGVLVDQRGFISHEFGDGDGTVPVWSSLPHDAPAGLFAEQASFIASHVGILKNVEFHALLKKWIARADLPDR